MSVTKKTVTPATTSPRPSATWASAAATPASMRRSASLTWRVGGDATPCMIPCPGTVGQMEQDAGRRLVVERDLVAAAFGHLTEAMMALPFESLGPVKTLLKRYLSTAPWTAEDDDALAAAVGPGEGWWSRALDADVALDFGWTDGRFTVDG